MKGFKKVLIAGIAAGAVIAGSSTLATAADFEAPAPVPTWTGFWIGGGVGYGFVNHELGADVALPPNEFISGKADLGLSGIGGEGWLGQVGAGFDFQVGEQFLIGIFGDYTFSDIESKAAISFDGCIDGDNICGDGAGYYRLKADSSWFVGGRAGWLANPDTLLYGLVGYTEVDFKARFGFDAGDPFSFGYGWSQGGITWGGGIETKLYESVTAKIEYRYTDLDRKRIFDVGDIGQGGFGARAWVNSNLQTVTASVAWRFWTGPGL